MQPFAAAAAVRLLIMLYGSVIALSPVMSFPGGSLTWLQRSIWRALWHVGRSSLHAWLAEAEPAERKRTTS
jgi:hypothetical protein